MESQLNHLLANSIVEYHKLQNEHWFVSGKDFFQAHAKLEELYNSMLPMIDDVAELVLQLGGKPVASLAEVLKLADVKEREDAPLTSADAFTLISEDFKALLDEVVAIKEQADRDSNYLVSAKMDEYIAGFSKTLWMLRQQAA